MKYLSMVRINEKAGVPVTPKLMDDMGKLMEELTRSGKLVSTAGLRPTSEGVRVRQRNGKQSMTDGPFVETKEHLGGFAVVDVPDDAAARYWAGRIAVAVGWPQEVHRFPHRALSAD